MSLSTVRVGLGLLTSLCLASCGEVNQPKNTSDQQSATAAQAPGPSEPETFNERVNRQKRYIPSIGRWILPAPEGDARQVAFAGIKEAGLACAEVTEAERLDSDGTIIAKCGPRDFRIFKIEGTATTMSLDCKVARDTFGVDACDVKQGSTREDDSIGRILTALAKS